MLLVQLTGLSGAGKSTLAGAVQNRLQALGYRVELIDGDVYRQHLCRDLGFSKADRQENIRRLGFVGLALARNEVITILSAISPYESARAELRATGGDLVKTVWVNCDIPTLTHRDTKGLYRRAALPDGHAEKVYNLTGVNDPYEAPGQPDLILNTHLENPETSTERLLQFILAQIMPNQGSSPPYALFIGRWQPFHNGHKWLIDQKLQQGVPVLIAVRDMPCDEQNPFTTQQVMTMIRQVYARQAVTVMSLPNIESVNYGRSVGYEINCFAPPADIRAVSATFVRQGIRNGDDTWKNYIDPVLHPIMEELLIN